MNFITQITVLVGILIGGAIATLMGLVADWEIYLQIAKLVVGVYVVSAILLSVRGNG